MVMDQRWPAFLDELEKIAVSVQQSPFPQTRRGRRPMRVTTMLGRTSTLDDGPMEKKVGPSEPEPPEYEGGMGMQDSFSQG